MQSAGHAIAIVGVGAVLPDAPDVTAFWNNIKAGRYSISEVKPERWDPALYYDPDPTAPDKTYSKIGGWVREHAWEPVKWKLAIPPCVVNAMDDGQKWAISCTRDALVDYGYPERRLDLDRTAVIFGNAMAGEKHYLTTLRIYFPEFARELENSSSFKSLPEGMRRDIEREVHDRMAQRLPKVTEDSMPGELANCIAGRVANTFNIHGPNFVTDAACASAMAAITAAVEGLREHDFDAALTGGIDRNMGAPSFVKFCKIGALSATGTRPYADGADGFVMGEGAGVFLLKRLEDAERDGDKIYALILGMGASSDGKGKGITAPNPIGQKFSLERGWKNAGVSPATAGLIEGHGTSTRVGDVVEVESLAHVLGEAGSKPGSVALGSVKSNFGHLKSAAGAAGVLKTALALHHRVLPPSANCEQLNPSIDFAHSPLYVNTELREWQTQNGTPRRAGVSAFGFGGTNFHIVMEEYVPGRSNGNGKHSIAVLNQAEGSNGAGGTKNSANTNSTAPSAKVPLRGALVIGAANEHELVERLKKVQQDAANGIAPPPARPSKADLTAPQRVAIDYGSAAELADKAAKALKASADGLAIGWKMLRAQGIFRGHGPASKVAFLYTGQGSQYVNMMRALRDSEPIVAEVFKEADRVLTPLLGKALADFIFVDSKDPDAVSQAEEDLRQTAITQPAVLATDLSLTKMFAAYGIEPDMTMGHSLGEYGALVAAGALPFEDALEAVSARGREMTRVSMADNGKMAAVFAPLEEIERILKSVDGYVVIANINSERQAVIGGASAAVEQAMKLLQQANFEAVALPVSHAFHTSIVSPASEPLRRMLQRLRLQSPQRPIVANVNGEFYPAGPNVVPQMLDILAQQVAAPVQFIKGLHTLYTAGARIFVEVGPKKALHGFVEDVLGGHDDVLSLFSNHPKLPDATAFNQALCGLYAAGLGAARAEEVTTMTHEAVSNKEDLKSLETQASAPVAEVSAAVATAPLIASSTLAADSNRYVALGRLFAEVLDRGVEIYLGQNGIPQAAESVVITGAALGLPGAQGIFDESNVGRILRGEQFIDVIPTHLRRDMLDKNITRLVKSDNGGATFETIDNLDDVIKLAGRGGAFDLEKEFGVSAERIAALDRTTMLAIAAGIDALRDAGIPLVMRYKTTSKGTLLPDRWGLPDALRDDTGVIFGSAFPGYDAYSDELGRYYKDHARREAIAMLEAVRARAVEANGSSSILCQEIDRRIVDLQKEIDDHPYVFDRRFLFRALSMGHSQFAEYIGARGPNTQINSACATTTQACTLAEDWIRAGRCRRVIIISADDVTSDHMIGWFGAGFLASGAAATDEVVEEAATPFDRRRHGLIMGMGAAAIVVEAADAARERGLQPICEVLGTVTSNSAFHGSRLDVTHIRGVMEQVIADAEKRHGISRQEIAPKTVFVSHETYTPARGGSASAEVHALRHVFGAAADQIIVANTKGFTGHAMATGIEDVLAIKALETGCVPPVPNFKEVDPELGTLNLSKGGVYPVEYALRLGAGFGSQISMTLLRWTKTKDNTRPHPTALGYKTRIVDTNAWDTWLRTLSGDAYPEIEVVQHTLRIADKGGATRKSAMKEAAVVIKPEPLFAKAAAASASASATATMPTIPAPMARAIAAEPKLDVAVLRSAEPASSESVAPKTPVVPPARVVTTEQVGPIPVGAIPPSTDDVKLRILALVAEKTGYPADMLDLDLDLEADLGIDTVKQAEIFAAIRGSYGIQRDDKVRLRDFPTLAHVIKFVHDRRPDVTPARQEATAVAPLVAEAAIEVKVEAPPAIATSTAAEPILPVAASATSQGTARDDVKERILALVVEKTGYPPDMLDLDLDLEADLGVDTVKQAELFAAIRESYGIPRDANIKLRDFPTLAHVIGFVHQRRPDLTQATAPAPVTETPVPPQSVAAAEPVIKGQTEPPLPSPAVETNTPTTVPATTSLDAIQTRVLEIVAEKTGYPTDMLDLDLDLEADLGIDTVKQAEMFAAIRAAYNIPRDANLKLRDFPTLAHVIKFAQERSAAVQAGEPSTAAATQATASIDSTTQPAAVAENRLPLLSFDAVNTIPRRVPTPVLRPPLDVCKTTGVTLGPGSRAIVVHDEGGVAAALTQALQNAGVTVVNLLPKATHDDCTAQLEDIVAAGPVHGVFWLPALDTEPKLTDLDLTTWHALLQKRLKSLYVTMHALYEQIATAGAFLVSATRLGGNHGYDPQGAIAPLGGAVTGFTKAYKRERPEVLVKAVDFERECAPTEIAQKLIAETLRDPGAVEIGYKKGLRWTVGLQEQPADDGQAGLTLDNNTVFLVTGAAGSIVSAITCDLAAASGGTFYLLDIVPPPDNNSADLKRLVSDKDGLKRELFARIQARGERATPALVEKELASLERAQAAQSAIDAVHHAGGTVHYFSVDMRDSDAVRAVINEIRSRSGKIDVLLHAAGLERSHFLPDKDPKEFDLVFDVKADGFFNLLHSVGDMPLGATVVFSSVAGRFGNGGQTDYSAANDLLCKITSSLRTTRPSTRGIAIDWTAWAGIGMATRGSIPKMMELAGIDMLPPEAGIPFIRRELTVGATRGEVVVAKGLGAMTSEFDPTGGVDTELIAQASTGPMIGEITSAGIYGGITIQTQLDPKEQPFLHDHQIEGIPVLPGVMGVEAFAEAASLLCPGWHVVAIEDVNFLAPFKFYRSEPRFLTINCTVHPHGDELIASCRLIGERHLPNQGTPQQTVHFTGSVRLTRSTPQVAHGASPSQVDMKVEREAIYRLYFHGPAYQVLECGWREGDHAVGKWSRALPENNLPASRATIAAPRLIEMCFQTAGLWEMGVQDRFGLPRHIGRVSMIADPTAHVGDLYAVVTPAEGGRFDAHVIDGGGNIYIVLSGYETTALPGPLDHAALEPLRRAMGRALAVGV